MSSPKRIMVLQWLCLMFLVTELGAVPILVANRTSVQLLDSEHPNEITVLTNDREHFFSFDYNIMRGELYVSEISSSGTSQIQIRKMSLIKGTPESSTSILQSSNATSIAVDWINDKLYWINRGDPCIEAATLEGHNLTVIFEAYDGVEYAHSLVIDPFERLLFWITGIDRKVTSGRTDGSNRHDLHSSIGESYGLALDISKKKLYISAEYGLYSSSYDGSNLKTLLGSQDQRLMYPFITSFFNKLFYADPQENVIRSLNLDSNQTYVIREGKQVATYSWLSDMKVLHASLQPQLHGATQCGKKCSHFCDNSGAGSCKCPHGFTLDQDEITCKYEGIQSGK